MGDDRTTRRLDTGQGGEAACPHFYELIRRASTLVSSGLDRWHGTWTRPRTRFASSFSSDTPDGGGPCRASDGRMDHLEGYAGSMMQPSASLRAARARGHLLDSAR